MTDQDKKDRESYRLKMISHNQKSAFFRKKVDMIDQKYKEAERDKLLNQCFRQNAGTKQKPSWHGYARVEYFDENFTPYGTVVNWYTDEKEPSKKIMISVELKHYLHTDWLLNGKKISSKEFEKYLKEIKELI